MDKYNKRVQLRILFAQLVNCGVLAPGDKNKPIGEVLSFLEQQQKTLLNNFLSESSEAGQISSSKYAKNNMRRQGP